MSKVTQKNQSNKVSNNVESTKNPQVEQALVLLNQHSKDDDLIFTIEDTFNGEYESIQDQIAELENEKHSHLTALENESHNEISQLESEKQKVLAAIEAKKTKLLSKIEDDLAKKQSQKESLEQVRKLLLYWRDTQKALTLLASEDVKATVEITIQHDGDSCMLRSTKIPTVKQVLDILGNSSRERMESLIKKQS